jgi:hypothetical protein
MAIPSFQISAIELHELVIKKPSAIPDPGIILNFEIKIDASVDPGQALVISSTTVRIKNGDIELGHIECACVFSVNNFSEMVAMRPNNQFEIDPPFADTLNSIAISTTRGVMYSELKGTVLHTALLPLLDIKTLKKAEVATP